MDQLHGICLTTVEEASRYLRRDFPGDDTDQVVAATNRAAAMLERLSGRKLAYRTYRDQVSAIGTVDAADLSQVRLSDGHVGVKVGDAVTWDNEGVASCIRPGAIVVSVLDLDFPPGDLVTISPRATEAFSDRALKFGSAPEVVSGLGSFWGTDQQQPLYASEYPVVELYAVKRVSADGTKDALDASNARLGAEGNIILPNDFVPRGEMNVEIHYAAGLRLPSTTYRGDADALVAQDATHWLAQIRFKDWNQARGRETDLGFGAITSRSNDLKIPDGLRDMIALLRRT